jgi:hypothetical protein
VKPWAAAALAFALAVPALAQTAQDVHEAERTRFGFGELRPGADGDPKSPRAANSDEAKVGSYTLPPLFENAADRTPPGWAKRRAELMRLVEDNWVGRIPEVVQRFRVVWRKEQVGEDAKSTTEQWIGQVTAPDGRSGPTIDAKVTFPIRNVQVPALIFYTYVWPGGRVPNFAAAGPPPPDPVAQALRHGFAYVEYRPQMLQSDNGATMKDGVIGLARWPRAKTDWGALRAWAWGASQLREELARDPRIDGQRISLTGHSRFGKGVLVAAAFDPAFADAHVSSSGAGGAKRMRRDFGERWENLVGSGEFHWFTPSAMFYAQQGHSIAELPIDAHSLIALRAPRPLFVTSGRADKGDSWVDPRGMWLATQAAEPAWQAFGAAAPSGEMPQAEDSAQAGYALAWYQHGQGHVPWPAYEQFYAHEAKFARH